MKRQFSRTLLLGLALLLCANLAFAQGIASGSISGTVLDQQQAVISGAKVTAKSLETNTETNTESNAVGYFTLRSLPIGSYSVTIEAPRFQKLKVNNVPVSVGRDTALGAKALTVGAEEVVNVESTPPLVETTTVQQAGTFASRQVTDLPIGVGLDQLQLFVPGVASAGNVGFGNNNGSQASVNGQRNRSNNFTIDGQSNNDNSVTGPGFAFSNTDAISEYQVITNYTAEYGRNIGSQVNYVTKSGSNNFHGTLFEYNQNSWLDSLHNEEKSQVFGFCAPGASESGPDGIAGNADDCTTPTVPQYNQNRFGFTIGGPVVKDKLWFFAGGFWDRIRIPGSVQQDVAPARTPTAAGLATLAAAFPGNVGISVLQTIGPTTVSAGSPEFANITTRFVDDDATVNCQQAVVPATCVGVEFGEVRRFISAPYNERELNFRGDWQLSSKDRLFGSYLTDTNLTGGALGTPFFASGYWIDVPARSKQARVDWTRQWSSRFVNQARMSYTRLFVGFEDGSTGCNTGNITDCAISIRFADESQDIPFGVASGFPQSRLVNNTQWQDNASLVLGRHTLKFGGSYDRQRSPSTFLPNLNTTWTYQAGVVGAGNQFNHFLANAASAVGAADGDFKYNFKEQDIAFYIQDDWRIKDNLTLNLGLRYEWFQQAINLLHDVSLARHNSATPFWDPALGEAVTTVPLIPEDKNNFAPSIGFTWQPRFWEGLFGKDKTTIRGGFRVAYDPAFYNMFLNVANSAPFVNSINFTPAGTGFVPTIPLGTAYDGNELRAAILPLIPTGAGVNPGFRAYTTVAGDFRNPYTQQWTFGVQREITPKLAAEVRYVGNHSVSLFRSTNGNPAGGGPAIAAIPAGPGFPGFAGLAARGAIGLGFDGTNPNRRDVLPASFTPCTDNGPNGVLDPLSNGINPLLGDDPPGRLNQHGNCSQRNVFERNNSGFSIYHGLQTELKVRNWHGLTANLAYTYSRVIDNTSEVFNDVTVGQLAFPANPFDLGPERGQSAISFPHVVGMTLIYDLPFYKSQQGILGRFLGGWSMNTTYRYTSGAPWTPRQASKTGESLCDVSNTFSSTTTSCRPMVSNLNAPLNAVGQCTNGALADCGLVIAGTTTPTTFDAVHWIRVNNQAAIFFGDPFLGVSRNTERGQTINTVNLSFYKTTSITERVKVQFQAVAFNVLNHQFLGQPNTSLLSGTFTSLAQNFNGDFSSNITENGIARRRMQFGLKVIF